MVKPSGAQSASTSANRGRGRDPRTRPNQSVGRVRKRDAQGAFVGGDRLGASDCLEPPQLGPMPVDGGWNAEQSVQLQLIKKVEALDQRDGLPFVYLLDMNSFRDGLMRTTPRLPLTDWQEFPVLQRRRLIEMMFSRLEQWRTVQGVGERHSATVDFIKWSVAAVAGVREAGLAGTRALGQVVVNHSGQEGALVTTEMKDSWLKVSSGYELYSGGEGQFEEVEEGEKEGTDDGGDEVKLSWKATPRARENRVPKLTDVGRNGGVQLRLVKEVESSTVQIVIRNVQPGTGVDVFDQDWAWHNTRCSGMSPAPVCVTNALVTAVERTMVRVYGLQQENKKGKFYVKLEDGHRELQALVNRYRLNCEAFANSHRQKMLTPMDAVYLQTVGVRIARNPLVWVNQMAAEGDLRGLWVIHEVVNAALVDVIKAGLGELMPPVASAPGNMTPEWNMAYMREVAASWGELPTAELNRKTCLVSYVLGVDAHNREIPMADESTRLIMRDDLRIYDAMMDSDNLVRVMGAEDVKPIHTGMASPDAPLVNVDLKAMIDNTGKITLINAVQRYRQLFYIKRQLRIDGSPCKLVVMYAVMLQQIVARLEFDDRPVRRTPALQSYERASPLAGAPYLPQMGRMTNKQLLEACKLVHGTSIEWCYTKNAPEQQFRGFLALCVEQADVMCGRAEVMDMSARAQLLLSEISQCIYAQDEDGAMEAANAKCHMMVLHKGWSYQTLRAELATRFDSGPVEHKKLHVTLPVTCRNVKWATVPPPVGEVIRINTKIGTTELGPLDGPIALPGDGELPPLTKEYVGQLIRQPTKFAKEVFELYSVAATHDNAQIDAMLEILCRMTGGQALWLNRQTLVQHIHDTKPATQSQLDLVTLLDGRAAADIGTIDWPINVNVEGNEFVIAKYMTAQLFMTGKEMSMMCAAQVKDHIQLFLWEALPVCRVSVPSGMEAPLNVLGALFLSAWRSAPLVAKLRAQHTLMWATVVSAVNNRSGRGNAQVRAAFDMRTVLLPADRVLEGDAQLEVYTGTLVQNRSTYLKRVAPRLARHHPLRGYAESKGVLSDVTDGARTQGCMAMLTSALGVVMAVSVDRDWQNRVIARMKHLHTVLTVGGRKQMPLGAQQFANSKVIYHCIQLFEIIREVAVGVNWKIWIMQCPCTEQRMMPKPADWGPDVWYDVLETMLTCRADLELFQPFGLHLPIMQANNAKVLNVLRSEEIAAGWRQVNAAMYSLYATLPGEAVQMMQGVNAHLFNRAKQAQTISAFTVPNMLEGCRAELKRGEFCPKKIKSICDAAIAQLVPQDVPDALRFGACELSLAGAKRFQWPEHADAFREADGCGGLIEVMEQLAVTGPWAQFALQAGSWGACLLAMSRFIVGCVLEGKIEKYALLPQVREALMYVKDVRQKWQEPAPMDWPMRELYEDDAVAVLWVFRTQCATDACVAQVQALFESYMGAVKGAYHETHIMTCEQYEEYRRRLGDVVMSDVVAPEPDTEPDSDEEDYRPRPRQQPPPAQGDFGGEDTNSTTPTHAPVANPAALPSQTQSQAVLTSTPAALQSQPAPLPINIMDMSDDQLQSSPAPPAPSSPMAPERRAAIDSVLSAMVDITKTLPLRQPGQEVPSPRRPWDKASSTKQSLTTSTAAAAMDEELAIVGGTGTSGVETQPPLDRRKSSSKKGAKRSK